MMIDTHCHLSNVDYEDLEQVIKRMENNIIIVSGVDLSTSKEALKLAKSHNNIYCTIGFHPTELKEYNEENLKEIEKMLQEEKVVGIGEIGLDFHYSKDDEQNQKKAFIEQIFLANKYNKTIVIHSRDAALETYEILKEYSKTKINIHCYSYSLEMAKRYLELGCNLGIGGVLTFKNSNKLKEVVKEIDISKLLLETDSPYLTPEPFRGKTNEPYNIYYVAKKISEIKNISLDDVLKITSENAMNQFDIK